MRETLNSGTDRERDSAAAEPPAGFAAAEDDSRDRGPGRAVVPLVLGALVALGAALRLWNLGATPLNFDESFTGMVGRLPLGEIFGFLRAHDSHPPLDYLLQLPFSRAGVSSFAFRLPAVASSIGALALFAWWMRNRGRIGILATAAMSICAFQLQYGREARMYGSMALIGVTAAVIAERWLTAPRNTHAVAIAALTFVGLMTHVSMALLAVGLITLAGRRGDAAAWRWRAGVAAGAAGWALIWGAAFVMQSRGGHSSWIPRTTPARFVDTIGALVVRVPATSLLVVVAVVAGGLACRRLDRTLSRVLGCCFVVPAVLAGVVGLRAPVLLDRTLMVVAWGPLVALAFFVDLLLRRIRPLGIFAAAIVAAAMLAGVPHALSRPGPAAMLAELESVARPGDVIAVQPPAKGVELDWSLAVRSDKGPVRTVPLSGIHDAVALALTGRPPSGRIWLMQLRSSTLDLRGVHLCRADLAERFQPDALHPSRPRETVSPRRRAVDRGHLRPVRAGASPRDLSSLPRRFRGERAA